MSFAVIPPDPRQKIRQLDKPSEPDEQVTVDELADQLRLQRLLMRILKALAGLIRRWSPDVLEFEDRAVDATGTTKYRFVHSFGGRVRWWVVDWSGASSGPQLVRYENPNDGTNTSTLVLVSHVAGTATVRIERAG